MIGRCRSFYCSSNSLNLFNSFSEVTASWWEGDHSPELSADDEDDDVDDEHDDEDDDDEEEEDDDDNDDDQTSWLEGGHTSELRIVINYILFALDKCAGKVIQNHGINLMYLFCR